MGNNENNTVKMTVQEWEAQRVRKIEVDENLFVLLQLSDSELATLAKEVRDAVSKSSGFSQAFEFSKPFISKALDLAIQKYGEK